MVAEASPNCTSPRKVKGRGHAREIDLTTRSHARNLYAVQHLTAQDVANRTGLTVPQVYSLAKREGWVKTRAQLKAKAEQALRAREEKQVEEIVEAVAIKSQVLSLAGLDKAIAALDRDDINAARDLQAYSQASKNFVGIFRQARGLDVRNAEQASAGQPSVSLFFLQQNTSNVVNVASGAVAPAATAGAASPVIDLPA